MKVSVPKDFGNTSKKHILPLVPEPIKSIKKEELTAVSLYSDLTDHNSMQVKFSFKGLIGDNETPREILAWRRNVERALIGLDLHTGTNQYNMAKQFMRGSTLSCFESAAVVLLTKHKVDAIKQCHPPAGDAAHDAGVLETLRAAVTTASNCKLVDHLHKAYGMDVVTNLLKDVVRDLLPNKTLQRVKRYLRREARKPLDMSVKQHIHAHLPH